MGRTPGDLVGGVLRLMAFFLAVTVLLHHVAPEAMQEVRRMTPEAAQDLVEDDATPRRPSRREEDGMEQPGVLFEMEERQPGNARGTAFKVGGGTLWLTAHHVVGPCDQVGVEMSPFHAAEVERGHSLPEADVAAIHLPAHVPQSLPLATSLPQAGDTGFHMGFPRGHRAVVVSDYMGEAEATVGARRRSPVLVWVERQRLPPFSGSLSGISGGPALNSRGELVGINIAVSERRGRILTAHPTSIAALLVAENAVTFSTAAGQAAPAGRWLTPRTAAALTRALENAGTLRRVFCRVG